MMKNGKVLVIVFLMSVLAGYAQTGQLVKVSGNLDFVATEKKVLMLTFRPMASRPEFDSCIVNEGKFRFERMITEPMVVILTLKRQQGITQNSPGELDYYSALLLPGEVVISAKSNLRSAIVSGKSAGANIAYREYLRQLNLYVDSINMAIAPLRDSVLTTEEREKRTTVIKDVIKLQRDQQVHLPFITAKPQTPVAAIALLGYAGEPVWTPRKKMMPEVIEKLLTKLPRAYQSYPSIISLKEELEVSKKTAIGNPVIDFRLEDTAGNRVQLSDFKGKYVFLDFWASWCVPCRKENPNVKKEYELYKDKGFTVLSVSLDKADAKNAWMDAIKKDQIGIWPHLIDTRAFEGEVAKSYYVRSIPTNFLIGPDGRFLGRNLYGEALHRALMQVFGAQR